MRHHLDFRAKKSSQIAVICHRELDEKRLEDLDDLCDNEVGINLVGMVELPDIPAKHV